jgi:hypothetical protein
MAKDHGSSVEDDKQYEGLRKKGMSKQRAASIANSSESSKKGGKRAARAAGAASPTAQTSIELTQTICPETAR